MKVHHFLESFALALFMAIPLTSDSSLGATRTQASTGWLSYQTHAGDSIGSVLDSVGVCPLWGKRNWVERTIDYNPSAVTNAGNFVSVGVTLKIPIDVGSLREHPNYSVSKSGWIHLNTETPVSLCGKAPLVPLVLAPRSADLDEALAERKIASIHVTNSVTSPLPSPTMPPVTVLNPSPLPDSALVPEPSPAAVSFPVSVPSRSPASDPSPLPSPSTAPIPVPSPASPPIQAQYGTLDVSTLFSYSGQENVDRSSGARGYFLSKQNWGGDFRWGQVWSKDWRSFLAIGATKVEMETNDSHTLEGSTQTTSRLAVGVTRQISDRLDATVSIGKGQALFVRSTGLTTNRFDSVAIGQVRAQFGYRLYQSDVFGLRVGATGSYLAPAETASYSVQSGYQYGGRCSLSQTLSRSLSLNGELSYETEKQSTSLVDRKSVEMGMALGLSFSFEKKE